MSVRSFQSFLSADPQLLSFGTCVRDVDLLRLNREVQEEEQAQGRASGPAAAASPRVALVVDGEDCLDRLYGGFFCDWSCGGQWAHMLEYLARLVSTLNRHNVQLAFFFNGALEPDRFPEWRARQLALKDNAAKVFKHVNKRATPPPKAWWLPPCGLHSMLRLALKTLNCSVFSSVEDHRQDVMCFCWENGYHGIMADDAEYAMVDPPRYFSAKALKMTFQFDITTVEYVLDEVAKSLDLNPNRFCLLGALLGNNILPTRELRDFHEKLVPELKNEKHKGGFDRVIRGVVKYIRTLPKIDDYDQLGVDVFGNANDPRVRKLKASVQYYTSCTQEGHQKTKAKNTAKRKKLPSIKLPSEQETPHLDKSDNDETPPENQETNSDHVPSKDRHADLVERIALDLDHLELSEAISAATKAIESNRQGDNSFGIGPGGDCSGGGSLEPKSSSLGEGACGGGDSKNMSVLQKLASGVDVKPSEEGKYPTKEQRDAAAAPVVKSISIPDVHPDIHRTALDRHRQAQMSPLLLQLLTRGEIKLPVLLEDFKSYGSVPPVHQLFQPLRQNVYAVIFNLHHHRYNRRQAEEAAKSNRRKADELRKQAKSVQSEAEKKDLLEKATVLCKAATTSSKNQGRDSVIVREWMPYNNYEFPDGVEAVELSWAVPTVQRLWFGSQLEDKQKRLRAFLSCMRCDNCPPLLSASSVPQHMVVLACVLRYIMTCQAYVVLSKPELDALLATAFSPELRDPRMLQELKVDFVTKRGIEISTMVMQGIDMALLANDACGAPIPGQMSLPWTFFDGKLFHSKLRRAETARNLMELCDGQMEIVYAVERMRGAILHGMMYQYAAPAAGPHAAAAAAAAAAAPYVAAQAAAAAVYAAVGGGRQPHPGSSGRLVVGGSVVGQWGPNTGGQKKKKKKKAVQKAKNSSSDDKDKDVTPTAILSSRLQDKEESDDRDKESSGEERGNGDESDDE